MGRVRVKEDSHRWGVDVEIDVGGGGGKVVLMVVAVLDGELSSINIEKMLCRSVVMKPLEEGSTKSVNLDLGDGPGSEDTRVLAFSHGVELVGRFISAFATTWLRDGKSRLGGRGCWDGGGSRVGVAVLGGLRFKSEGRWRERRGPVRRLRGGGAGRSTRFVLGEVGWIADTGGVSNPGRDGEGGFHGRKWESGDRKRDFRRENQICEVLCSDLSGAGRT
jgi:hypothetical protein